MAALAAANSYYRSNYAGNNAGFPNPVGGPTGGVNTARTAASTVIAANGYSPSILVGSPELLDFQSNALPDQCDPTPCPGPTDVRGFELTLKTTVPTTFLRAIGISESSLGGHARSSITTPGGAAREAPLLLQNFGPSTFSLPRNGGYIPTGGVCATAPGDGVQYSPTPDCRPTMGTGAAPVALVPADESSPPALASPFTLQAGFYILHNPPSCPTDVTCNATSTTVQDGEREVIQTCPPAPCSTFQYSVALDHGASDGIIAGMNSRISTAIGGTGAGQDCSQPLGGPGVPPLTPDNPRLMRLPINYGSPITGSGNVGQARVSETVMFCVQYTTPTTPVPPAVGSDYAVPGYVLNTVDLSATSPATPSAYFGQDVLIRLIP